MNRIGVLGGTFDPVHYGHVYLAQQALVECTLSRLVIMPAKVQPFKQEQEVTSGLHRMKMAELAFAEIPETVVSDLEMRAEGVSYTIKTLRALKTEYGEKTEIHFIAGADSLLKMETWRESDEILKNHPLIIGYRPGFLEEELFACIRRLTEEFGARIVTIKNKQISISSTELRKRLHRGEDCSGFIPEAVERYIRSHGLYRELH